MSSLFNKVLKDTDCFNSAFHEMNRLTDKPTLQLDKWSFHADCACCVALKVLKQRAIAAKDAMLVQLRRRGVAWVHQEGHGHVGDRDQQGDGDLVGSL